MKFDLRNHSRFLFTFQVSKLQGFEQLLYSCFGDVDHETEEMPVNGDSDYKNDASENGYTSSRESVFSEPTGPQSTGNLVQETSIHSYKFENDVRQHLHDILKYIDDLERQVFPYFAHAIFDMQH